jgi:DNA-binding MarR family transcriptional regulator
VHKPEVEDVSDAVLTASRVLVALAATSMRDVEDQVTLTQYRTLVVLQSRGPQTLQALAAELQVVPSTATRMCDRLVKKRLIERQVVAENRREVELSITDAGAEIVGTVARARRRELRRIIDRMSPSTRASLVTTLEDFTNAAGEVPETQWYLGWS